MEEAQLELEEVGASYRLCLRHCTQPPSFNLFINRVLLSQWFQLVLILLKAESAKQQS